MQKLLKNSVGPFDVEMTLRITPSFYILRPALHAHHSLVTIIVSTLPVKLQKNIPPL